MNKIGGMDVQMIDNIDNNVIDAIVNIKKLGTKPYVYNLLQLGKQSRFTMNETIRCCIYLFECEDDSVKINGQVINKKECFLGDVLTLDITALSKATVLIAYHSKNILEEKYSIFSETEAKKVEKPWGYEIWLTGDPSELFAFKRIYIKAGNKTSLQYHKMKRETNFIVDGTATLSYDNKGKYNEGEDFLISESEFSGPFVVDVFPNTIHRLEAITDLMLLEVSTPELDDVIRLQDDAGRSHGRVHNEH